jgi:hypothetical protein
VIDTGIPGRYVREMLLIEGSVVMKSADFIGVREIAA